MADLVIERVLPSERETEIKALFDRAGEEAFSKVFDRVYLAREAVGLRSWIGLSEGRVVMHMSVGFEQFSDGSTGLKAGILGDLMVDAAHRDLWGPVKLARRMTADVRKEATADFLLTYYTPAAEAVFRAAGFKPLIEMRRHVFPLYWPYLLLRRMRLAESLPRLTAIPFGDPAVNLLLPQLASPGAFRPVPTPAYFATRMPRVSYPAGTWLVAGDPQQPEALILVSPRTNKLLVVADVLWRGEQAPLAGVMSAVVRWAAQQRYRRLTVTTIESSPLSAVAVRAGFLVRPERRTVMILALSKTRTVPPPAQWAFSPFVLTSW